VTSASVCVWVTGGCELLSQQTEEFLLVGGNE
jgi:hypothetical protein